MLQLDVGSVVLFGSGFADGGKKYWVLDTVFVVGDYVDHNVTNFNERLTNRVPACYEQVVLGRTYGEHAERRHLPRRLYIGATHAEPREGMFSFFSAPRPATTEVSHDQKSASRPTTSIQGFVRV